MYDTYESYLAAFAQVNAELIVNDKERDVWLFCKRNVQAEKKSAKNEWQSFLFEDQFPRLGWARLVLWLPFGGRLWGLLRLVQVDPWDEARHAEDDVDGEGKLVREQHWARNTC